MHFEFFGGLVPWLILIEDGILIIMSWIAWIHGLVGSCDSDEVTVQD